MLKTFLVALVAFGVLILRDDVTAETIDEAIMNSAQTSR